jgi:superfamily II DNA or RNA helicase
MVTLYVNKLIRVRGLFGTQAKADITKRLTIQNPEYLDRKRRNKSVWGIEPKLYCYQYDQGDLIIPRGFLFELKLILTNYQVNYDVIQDTSNGTIVDFGLWNPEKPLRDYQETAVNALTSNGIMVAPAGGGKTNIGLNYMVNRGLTTVWLTHTADLMYQTKERAEDLIPDIGHIGIIGDSKSNYGSGKLIIAMIQTLARNPDLIRTLDNFAGTLIIDECHHIPAPMFQEVISQFSSKNMLGITATPDRKDRLESYMYFGVGPLLHTVEREGLYTDDYLLKPEIKFIYTDFDYEPASIYNEDLHNVDAGGEDLNYHDLMDKLTKNPQRLELVAETILNTQGDGIYSLVISESVRMCYWIASAIRSADYVKRAPYRPLRVEVIHGPLSQYGWRVAKSLEDAEYQVKMGQAIKCRQSGRCYQVYVSLYTAQEMDSWQINQSKRRDILDRATNRQIDVLICTQLGKEGLDLPHLTNGYLTTPKHGDSAKRADGSGVEQYIGRIQRIDKQNPDKKPVWYDFVDNRVGVLYSQYLTRRKVYKRLGLKVPRAPKTEIEKIDDFLGSLSFPDFKI